MAQDSYLVGLIGSGIGHSLSPELHEREADRQGVRHLYRLVDLNDLGMRPEDSWRLVRAAGSCGFNGLNVTHPCKQLIVPHLDELSETAVRLGAVNTIVFTSDGRAMGHNTDITGFRAAFVQGLPGAPLRHVVQLGAGGAGSAVAHALLDLGVARLSIVDAVAERAHALVKTLNKESGAERAKAVPLEALGPELADADGLVNASPIGMTTHPGLPLPADMLHGGLWVVDLVYRPLETPLLHAARIHGCRVQHGGGMLVHQAAYSFREFTGITPNTSAMLADFADLTAAPQAHT
ncbi:shikimate dehydrogenase [Streptomyces canus]|uniref:shikimate dehydrogenase n=1 Tax=Streptomyces canus TaxID=58343 RepID=UPI002784BD59|nr:shikimate dehydrogenase [Streptomyces canus]MDQ0596088.1 shikimate dehydrogenase [Streptomyces canus]